MRKIKKAFQQRQLDLANFNQVRNMAMSFKVTVEELKAAAEKVGLGVDDLRSHLNVHNNPYVHRTKGWHL